MATSEEQNMGNLVPLQEVERMAAAVAKSGLFGVKTPEQAMSLMLIAQAEGLHPAIAARDYHVIQGRPSLKADAMLARFQAAGGKVEWLEYTDQRVAAKFSHPTASPKPVLVEWTMERAKNVKTYDKEDRKWVSLAEKLNYKNYPRAMLRARVISEGVRSTYPGVTAGLYTPEEIEDQQHEIREMGEAEVVDSGMQPRAVEPEKAAPENVTDAEVVDKGSPEKAQPAQASNGTGAPVSENNMRVIRAQLGRSGKTEEALCKHFGIGKLDELTVDKLNEAVAWAKTKD
jgi:hypothetical protein